MTGQLCSAAASFVCGYYCQIPHHSARDYQGNDIGRVPADIGIDDHEIVGRPSDVRSYPSVG
ncbi:hypothetical protein ACIBEK_06440 [Nocardia fusca]|uniref:hypothetical protein n=1 Tax=Nocardia fusca TaxID=941183 RepID=UPI0037A06FC7